jgi:hypothetical protein
MKKIKVQHLSASCELKIISRNLGFRFTFFVGFGNGCGNFYSKTNILTQNFEKVPLSACVFWKPYTRKKALQQQKTFSL